MHALAVIYSIVGIALLIGFVALVSTNDDNETLGDRAERVSKERIAVPMNYTSGDDYEDGDTDEHSLAERLGW